MMKKLYIIDDDSDFLEIATHIFRKDYDLLTASSLDIPELSLFRPDLILMDNAVGRERASHMIWEMYDKIPLFATPIILVSGHHDINSLATIKGIVGVIQKPASVQEIRTCVSDFFFNS